MPRRVQRDKGNCTRPAAGRRRGATVATIANGYLHDLERYFSDSIGDETASRRSHAESPLPLRCAVPAAPFPVEALGVELAAAACAIQARTQAPLALCGQAVLAAAALAAQAHADVRLPDGRQRPLSLALLSVAAPGERLDAIAELAWRAVRAEERQRHRDYRASITGHGVVHDFWRAGRRVGTERTAVALARHLQAATPEPEFPCPPVLLAGDPTPRSLLRPFAAGVGNLGWFDAEGATALTLGRAPVARRQLIGTLARLWDDGTCESACGREGFLMLYGRRLSVHLAAAPGETLARLVGDEEDQRLFGRLLAVMPASTAGTRLLDAAARRRAADAGPALEAYDARLTELLHAAHQGGELTPRPLPLAADAALRWRRFSDEVERMLAGGGARDGMRIVVGRTAEQVGRLAGVLSLFADRAATEISDAAVEGAIALVRHYLGEAARIAAAAGESAELRAAQAVLDYIRGLGRPVVHLAEIYQGGPSATRDAAAARRALRRLEEHGYLEKLPDGVVAGGLRRREAWRVVVTSETTSSDDAATVSEEDATATDDGAVAAAKVAKAVRAADASATADAHDAAMTAAAAQAAQVAKAAKVAVPSEAASTP